MTTKLMNLLVSFVVLSYFDVESCHSSQTSTTEDTQQGDLSKTDLALHRSIKKLQQEKQRSKRSVDQYYLELLIVVDRSMVDFHGDELVPYLAATMAAVQHLFKYALVDGSIQLQVTDIMKLDNSTEHIDYTNGTTILDSFCTWKQRSVSQNDSQHDAALFLTRTKIPNNILGYANINTFCQEDSCLMVRDIGLGSVNNIAHELGHVLGAQHDDPEFCHTYFGNWTTNNNNLMSANLRTTDEWWKWSECSTWTMTYNLRELKNNCLTNNSFKGEYIKMIADHRFLGQHYSLNKQCQLLDSSYPLSCEYRPCEDLRCRKLNDTESYCSPTNVLWADGTECGAGKWCENGQCVQADQEVIQRLKDEKWIHAEVDHHKTESKIVPIVCQSVNTTFIICLICLSVAVAIGIIVVFRRMNRTSRTSQI